MSTMPSTAGSFGRGPERRRHPRFRVIEKQLVTVDLGPQHRGLLVDVSLSGAAIQPYSPMADGQSSLVKFEVPGEELPFEAEGVVTWVGPSGRVGLRFQKINEVAEQALREWIASMAAPASVASNYAVQKTAAYLPPSYSPWIKMSEVAVEHDSLDYDGIGSLDLVSALRLVVERARSLTRATGAAIAVADQTDMVCRARTGVAPDLGARFSPDSGLSGEVVRTGAAVRCPDTSHDPRVDQTACEHLNIRSIVIVPILSGRAVIGVIEIFSGRIAAFDDRHVLNLTRLADLVSAMLEAGMEGILPAAILPPSDPDSLLASEASGTNTHIDPLSELDGAIETEPLLHMRSTSVAEAAVESIIEPAGTPSPEAERGSAPACSKGEGCGTPEQKTAAEPGNAAVQIAAPQTPEEIRDIYNRFVLENETADRRRRNKILVSVIGVLALGAGGLAIAKTMMTPTAQTQVAQPMVAAAEGQMYEAVEQPPALTPSPEFEAGARPDVTTKPAGGSGKAAKPSSFAEHWTWKAPTRPGTGSDLTLEAAAVAPVVTDTVVGSRGDVKVISDMLGSWPASSPRLSTPEPQIRTVQAGKLISRVNPIFPPMASASGLHGRVELKVAIDKEGVVTNVQQTSGNAILGAAAVQAVRKWRYEPSQLDGRPVDVEKTIIIDFADPHRK